MTVTAVSSRRLLQDRRDRERIGEYRASGGYEIPRVAAADLMDEIAAAGVRGRGGAAFSTAVKWRSVATAAAPRHVVVLEGALLTAAAVAAGHVWIYVSDAGAARAMRTAIGGPALPTTKPPRPFEAGVRGQPTLVQNAETLAHVTLIARRGATWFRSVGTAMSPGTFLLTMAGDCAAPGLFEVELGTPLRTALAWGGGTRRGLEPGGFLFGGYFGGIIAPRAADLPLEYDVLRGEGVGLGCGAITVIGSDRCIVGVATAVLGFYARQSSAQCGVCVRGTQALHDTARQLHAGSPRGGEAQTLARHANSIRGRGACALPDGAANIVTSLLREFPAAVEAHLAHGSCNDACPSVFAVDEWGYAYTTDPQGNVAAADEPAAREAIAGCPEHAITET